jgi:hypothetical protein
MGKIVEEEIYRKRDNKANNKKSKGGEKEENKEP